MSIYTKTGDKGETGSFNGKRISKSSNLIQTIGAIDELNSFLGIINSGLNDLNHRSILEEVQANLFTINSILAGANIRFSKTKTKKLEKQIDIWEGILPVQKNFIYYGGTPRASQIFFARAICRRAERALVVHNTEYKVPSEIMTYINRLSDYLFMMARVENNKEGNKEVFWKNPK